MTAPEIVYCAAAGYLVVFPQFMTTRGPLNGITFKLVPMLLGLAMGVHAYAALVGVPVW